MPHELLPNEGLMELQAQRKDREKRGRNKQPERFTMARGPRKGQGIFLISEEALKFEAQDLSVEQCVVHEGCNLLFRMAVQGLPCHL